MQYRLKPDAEAVDKVHAAADAVRDQTQDAISLFKNEPATAQRLSALAAQAGVYRDAFDDMVALQNRRNELVAEMSVVGKSARERLGAIMTSADRDGDARAAVLAGETLQHLLLGRLYAERFLLDNQPKNEARAQEELNAAATRLSALDRELQNPNRRQLLSETTEFKTRFETVFSGVTAVIAERNAIRHEKLDVIGPAFFAELTALREGIKDHQNTIGPKAAARFELTSTVITVVGALAVLFGIMLAIVAPRMLRGLVGLQQAIGRIAQQEDNVAVPGLNRGDEVGAIARAVDTISSSGAAAARVTAAIDSSTTATVILDSEDRCVYENAAFAALIAHRADAFAPIAPMQGETRLGAGLRQAIVDADAAGATRQQQNGEKLIEIHVGDGIYATKSSTVRDGNGAEIGTTIAMTDITSIRTLENEVVDVIQGVENGQFDQRVNQIDDLGFTSFVARGLNRLLDTVSSFMSALDKSLARMADRDLTQNIEEEFRGEFEAAKRNLNANLEQFRAAIGRMASTVQTVEAASRQIETSAQTSAEGAESQASSLQETAATMEEMASTIRTNAVKAASAAELAADARTRASKGRGVVGEAVEAMDAIEDSSTKISDIISVIDGISFQTNLLALNAAVEAARAGEAGKGFAVVAAEVRDLAQRAADAAQDIKNLISDSSEHVGRGVQLVNQTGDALDEINDSIERLNSMIDGISQAGKEQASGVEEINAALSDLDSLTQRNAAIAEQSAGNAKELAREADQLKQLAGSFATGETEPQTSDLSDKAAA